MNKLFLVFYFVYLIKITIASECVTQTCDYCIDAQDIHAGLVLSIAGTYCLSEDVHWTPSLPGQSAITIVHDNVRLDLKGHLLEQARSRLNNSVAITVANDTSNVVITNGFISGFSGLGIYVKSGVNTISITNLKIRECGYNGLFSDALFSRPFAGGILVAGNNENFVTNIHIKGCEITELMCLNFPIPSGQTIPAGGCNGITIIRASNVLISKSRISHIESNDAATPIFIGTIQTLKIKETILTDTLGDRNANGIDSMVGPSRRSTNVVFQDLQVGNIRGIRGEGLGIEPNALHFTIRNCYVFNISTGNGNRAAAFVTQDNDGYGLYENCVAEGVTGNVTGNPDSGHGIVGGFINTLGNPPTATVTGTRSITFKNCEAKNILGTGTVYAVGGIIDTKGRSHVIDGFIVSEVNSTYPQAIIAGMIFVGTQFTSVSNAVVSNTQGNGFLLMNTELYESESSFNTFSNNKALNNDFSGFNDQSGTHTNAFYSNYAQKNGDPLLSGSNYQGINPQTIRHWQLSSPFGFGGPVDPMANIDVIA